MDHQEKDLDRWNGVPSDINANAREGDAVAQLELGKLCFNMNPIENNCCTAFEWIYHSAEQGNMEAQFRLGDLYALGHGTQKKLFDAYKWYTKTAIQGYKKTLIRIHNLYQDDVRMHCCGQVNSEEQEWADDKFKAQNGIRELNEYRLKQHKPILNGAIDYYTALFKHYQARNQEDPTVQLNLAFLYQHGYGVKKCTSWAFEYYTLAAEQGNINAQYNLGSLYQKHTDIKFNYRQAFKWYKKSAQGGNIAAQKSLAYFYLKGLATDIDYDVAFFWYTRAAEAGDSASQVILGKLYRKGDCVKQELSMAVKWYSQAARQGNIVAQNCLAQLHQRGMLDDIELEEDMSEDSMNSRLCTKLSLVVSKLGDSPKFKQLNELAKRALIGDGHAMYEIGLKYLNGDSDFTQDLETGVKWIKNAANTKHKGAQLMIADLYKKGDSIEQDYYKAAIWYKTLAKEKDAQAQFNVGLMYNEGLGVRQDPLEASKWFIWAADQGNSDGQYYLGRQRLEGRAIRQDREEAVKWFLKSAHQQNPQACYEIGNFYLEGEHQIEQNRKRGLALLEMAANNGNRVAQLKLGQEYRSGHKKYRDLSKSTVYYTMSADSGNYDAQNGLAFIYLHGYDIDSNYIKIHSLLKQGSDRGYRYFSRFFETPVEPSYLIDYSKMLNMFIEVTKRGFDDLHYNIGFWYEHGIKDGKEYAVDINYASAIEWYLIASDNGDSRADYRLGIMHEYGKHFESNMDTAICYYSKASLQGNTNATYRLGNIYANGYGVAQDLLKAYHLFTKVFSLGNEDAGNELKIERSYNISFEYPSTTDPILSLNRDTRISMLEKATEEGFTGLHYQLGVMYEGDKNYQKAFKLFSLASEIGVTDACFRLGTLYEEGRGVDQDYTLAAKMYQTATEKEHEDACYRLGRLYQHGNGVELDYLKSYHFYKKAADIGHAKACKILDLSLGTGLNSNEDTKLSSQEYQDSLLLCKYVAEHGNTEMQFKVGSAYEHSISEPNYMEAYKWYSMAAKSSHQEALYHLGLLYENGQGVSQNYSKAIQLYEQASQQKNDDALYRLGVAYHYGKGVEVDSKKAVEYYTSAAEQGKPEYQCQLGELYEEGKLAEKNLLEALRWYTKAYLQGYDTIKPRLSTMYEHKPYEDFFFERLLHNLSIASCGYFRLNDDYKYDDYGEINSRLGALYVFGHGTNKDINKAWEYFSKEYNRRMSLRIKPFLFLKSGALNSSEKKDILNAIEQDGTIIRQMDEEELYALGMHFLYGVQKVKGGYTTFENRNQDKSSHYIVIEKNYIKAFKHLKKLANNNHAGALLQLGMIYHCAYGVEKNIEQGEKCFDSLVKSNLDYVGRIAMLYHTHFEMQNFEKALEWYMRLEKRLDEDLDKYTKSNIRTQIHFGMGLLYEFGDGVKQSYQKAFAYYKKLGDNYKAGRHRLGLMYYCGKGVPVDYKEALNLFEQFPSYQSFKIDLPYVHYQIGLDSNETQKNLMYHIIYDYEILGESYYYLGLMHKHGQGVLQDEEIARDYFKVALGYWCERAKYEL